MFDWVERNTGMIAVTCMSGIVLVTQFGTIQTKIAENSRMSEMFRSKQIENQRLETEKIAMEQSKEIANDRYNSGCEVIATVKNADVATTIQEGKPIFSGAYAPLYVKNPNRVINPNHFIGRDITVCDVYGTTAIMQFNPSKGYAVAGSIAVTSDRAQMSKALERMKGLKRPSLKGN
ncbi:MAG: hypothetical protein KME10_28010 [Plectolyngbya sp. WJT66-NPBG17]|jgi:hypothetical protein|nr:hypothetical protein [Plectolyngbya sp. WJT66-NPBG17]